MSTRNLVEAAALVTAPSEGDTWKVRLINEGRGSSGVYSADLLENYGHAFNGAISFLNHPTGGPESRNFTEIVGRVVGETWTERAEDGTLGVYANWEPDEDHRRKLEKYKESLGLSIYISGSGSEDENGDFLVESFDFEDPFRSVDVVIAAGRGGRFELTESVKKMYESRRSESELKPGVTSAQQENRKLEMEKDVEERFAAIEALLTSLVAKENAAQAEALQVEANDEAVEARVGAYDAAVDAIEAAELPAEAAKTLRAEARKGADITPLIELAKTVKTATVSESSAGREIGLTATEVSFSGFGGK